MLGFFFLNNGIGVPIKVFIMLAEIIKLFMSCSFKNKKMWRDIRFPETLPQLRKTKTSTKIMQTRVQYACLCVRVNRLGKIFII